MSESGRPRHPNSRIGCWRSPPPNEAAARRRQQRIADGTAMREAEAAAWPGRAVTITQSDIILPLLQMLADTGGARPRDLYDELATRFGLDAETRAATQTYRDGQTTNLWDRKVRFAMQQAKRLDLAANGRRGVWQATGKGEDTLGIIRPGLMVTVFRTAQGKAVAAWAEQAAAAVEPGSLNLLFTSPLFPLLKGKSYGSMTPAEWLPWMLDLLDGWKDLLAENGSIVFHLGDVHYRGLPSFSGYMDRFVTAAQDDLGLHKMQSFYWCNPTRPPETEWAAKREVLVRNTTEPLYWLSKSPFPKADARAVAVPYSEATVRTKIGHRHPEGKVVRPSGLDMADPNWSRDRGGSLPGNLIIAANSASNDPYHAACRTFGLPAHPAPMPEQVPGFFIDFLTAPGDLVGDFFGGSCTTGAAAEQRGRRWLCLDRAARLLEGASHRPQFRAAPGFQLESRHA